MMLFFPLVFLIHRITIAAEIFLTVLPLSSNSTIKQSERNIGAVAVCASEIGNQTVTAHSINNLTVLSIDSSEGNQTVTAHSINNLTVLSIDSSEGNLPVLLSTISAEWTVQWQGTSTAPFCQISQMDLLYNSFKYTILSTNILQFLDSLSLNLAHLGIPSSHTDQLGQVL